VGAALDKPGNEPSIEGGPEAVGAVDCRDGKGVRRARAPTGHRARAPAAAVSRPGKRKAKRDERSERKVLARRELERRLRAQFEGRGTEAEAIKLIDDLREAQMQAFRDLMGPANF
jgi:hypothetical protein